MPLKLIRRGVVLLSLFVAACSVGDAANHKADQDAPKPTGTTGDAQVNPDAKVLADFKTRVDAYMALHNKLAKDSPPLKETTEPTKIRIAQDALAGKIREARNTAKPG